MEEDIVEEKPTIVEKTDINHQMKVISKDWYEKYADWLAFPTTRDGRNSSQLWCVYCRGFLRPKKDNVEKHFKTSKHQRCAKEGSMQDVETDGHGRVIVMDSPSKNKQGRKRKTSIIESQHDVQFEDDINDMNEMSEVNEITIDENHCEINPESEGLSHSIFSNFIKLRPACTSINIPIGRDPNPPKFTKSQTSKQYPHFPIRGSTNHQSESYQDDDIDIFSKFIASELRTSIKYPHLRNKAKKLIQMNIFSILDQQEAYEKKMAKRKRDKNDSPKKSVEEEFNLRSYESDSDNEDLDNSHSFSDLDKSIADCKEKKFKVVEELLEQKMEPIP